MKFANIQMRKTPVHQAKQCQRLDIHCEGQMPKEKFWKKHIPKSTPTSDLKPKNNFLSYLFKNKIFTLKTFWYYFFVGIFPM